MSSWSFAPAPKKENVSSVNPSPAPKEENVSLPSFGSLSPCPVTKKENKSVRLSAMSLGEAVSLSDLKNQFIFVVGREGREHPCSLVQACFISGKVRQLVASDSTMNVLRVLPDEECSVFGFIERLWNGECIEVETSIVEPLLKVSRELENEELSSLLVNWTFSNGEVSVENCISRLHLKENLGLDSSEELEFVSSRFSEFSLRDLACLTPSEVERVLTHESLKIEDENSLLDYILDLVSRDESCSSLFKYVRFEYLDCEHLDVFLESVYPDHVECVWNSIADFIRKSVKTSPKEASRTRNAVSNEPGRVFQYDASPFSGIISHLRTECGGNPHSKGIINITASSKNVYSMDIDVLVDYDHDGVKDYATQNIPNSWIQFDFKERRVSLESYTLDIGARIQLLQWKLEGSNDASSWIELDSQNREESRGRAIFHFTCGKQTKETFRYIRLTQTGLNSAPNHWLSLCHIEFFGTLTA